jgi:basic membrane protein A
MLKRVETASKVALDSVKNGTFKAEVVVLDTKADGVGFSSKNAELGADIVAQIEAAKAKIISGEIKVAAKYADAKALPGFPQKLQAKDE